MTAHRGDLWWADLPPPRGSEPGFRRPVVIIQANPFNRSGLQTVIVISVTSNLRLADAPGNVFLDAQATGLNRDSVANVSQLLSIDRSRLLERIASLPAGVQRQIDEGLRLILDLGSPID